MFTGLVDDVGTVERVSRTAAGRHLRISCRYDDLSEGESVAVNGACLTVVAHGSRWFDVAAIETTVGRTTIGEWREGRRVNLERALRADGRFGGHLVLGHVDGVARVEQVARRGDAVLVDLSLEPEIAELMVPHGSVTIDGVSLTVNELPTPATVQVSLIEHTLRHTTLGTLAANDRVHVEADIIGKYVRRLFDAQADFRLPRP
ncbi:MAG TPA: riboflavin synthase [Gemmatimonadaceae bacterium]|nr:riboflavin synthase [Gemmatimonadaceae bacterium]